MLRIDRSGRLLHSLTAKKMREAKLLERADLQQMIKNSPQEFCAEIGEQLIFLGEEIRPTEIVDDRIDVLALDKDGSLVVIELKRDDHKLQLLQGIGYAAMIAEWDEEKIVSCRAQLTLKALPEAREEIEDFLNGELSSTNEQQRILLFAEDFDYEVLAAAKWLTESHGVDIACWKFQLAADGDKEYLSLVCVYPPNELADAARTRKNKQRGPARWSSWDQALEGVHNKAEVEFFRAQIAQNIPSQVARRVIYFKRDGRRMYGVHVRNQHSYVRQRGRFESDIAFWADRLGSDASIETVRHGTELRFALRSKEQFQGFLEAWKGPLTTVNLDRGQADDSDEANTDDDQDI